MFKKYVGNISGTGIFKAHTYVYLLQRTKEYLIALKKKKIGKQKSIYRRFQRISVLFVTICNIMPFFRF